jgi:phosphate acetyltransferase
MKASKASNDMGRFGALLRRAADIGAMRVGVVHPCDEYSFTAAVEAADAGLINPIFFAPIEKLKRVAAKAAVDLTKYELVDVPHSHAAAQESVKWASERRIAALMKGSLHTDELMSAALSRHSNLRTGCRASHVFMIDLPTHNKLLFLSDGAINIQPDLLAKADILRNAIDFARAFDVVAPHVAILSAIETINPKIVSTVDAAALCKMAERGQIEGAIVDGPLAFDNAISAEAARVKGIVSPVSGRVDVMIAPDMESANLMVKQLVYLAGACAAGVVTGLKVPIVLNSRADPVSARLAACAVAALYAGHLRERQ